ncbi:hypothetical protein D3C80_1353100 [compost metagenome]
MISVAMMLNAATAMIISSNRPIMVFSIFIALNRLPWVWVQSSARYCSPRLAVIALDTCGAAYRSLTFRRTPCTWFGAQRCICAASAMCIRPSEPSSSAPTLNTPTTFRRCMRGVMPPGALLTSGTIRVSLSPTLRRKRRAVISPMTTPNSPGLRSSRRP